MTTIYGPIRAKVVGMHDGDTVSLDLDLGFGMYLLARNPFTGESNLSCRVFGINAPELSTQAGKDALAYALSILPIGTVVEIKSHGWDKYGGRFDGEITLPDGSDFGQTMISSGHAVPYSG